jgi:hypothetical protein
MRTTLISAILLLAACGGDDTGPTNEGEVITTVILSFQGGATEDVFEFDDPDGDGGDPPTIDPINIAAGTYTVTVGFENRLEAPPEDITAEVADEADEHQVFLTGSAVDGPASDQPGAPLTHTYADQDSNGLPIGLENTIVAGSGPGELTVTLRHMPPINDQPTKTADTAAAVRDGGFSSIGGENDVQVTFVVSSNAPTLAPDPARGLR